MKLRDLKRLIQEELNNIKNERKNVSKFTHSGCTECTYDSDCPTGQHCSDTHGYEGHDNCCVSAHGMAQMGNKGMRMQRPMSGGMQSRPMARPRQAAMRGRRNQMRNRRMP